MSNVVPECSPSNLSSTAIWAAQKGFDELGRPLRDLTFCVVDLETTGGSAQGGSMITEIGAVKVRGGEILGEFQTLVNPETAIPAFISVLTGISDPMVAQSPTIDSVLPSFLEFAAGTILVAHNAPFDVGFLKHFAEKLEIDWPNFETLCTAKLARKVIIKGEAPNCKLSSLAVLFGAESTPNHRALADARATVDVLHGLMARVGNLGVHTFEELTAFSSRVTTSQRRKRHLGDHLPHAPGVYLFKDAKENILYVGTSRDLRTRVRTYFTASETRSRMGEMINLAERVDYVVCPTQLDAQIRELRLIAAHKPQFNRRSRFPERTHFVKLTTDIWPRLSVVTRSWDDGASYLGPFGSRKTAERVSEALHEAFPIRQCRERLPLLPSRSACALGELGKCIAPCDGSATPADYTLLTQQIQDAMGGDAERLVDHFIDKMASLSHDERFEEAALQRDRLAVFVRSAARSQRLERLIGCPQIIATHRNDAGKWEVHIVRFGRLVGAGVIPAGANAHEFVAELETMAEFVLAPQSRQGAASAEESEIVDRWLSGPGVRLVEIDGEWTCPTRGSGRHLALHDAVEESRKELAPFDRDGSALATASVVR